MESDESFSRLIALTKLNIVPDYTSIRGKTAFVVGVGGVGSMAAEMLVRCGVGRLYLYDFDTVELANMNRMFFTPADVGRFKVDAAKKSLDQISQGNCEIFTRNGNICSIPVYLELVENIKSEQQSHEGDLRGILVLCCVDNYAARVTLNKICLETQQVWLESGVSETAMSGHVQLVNPGYSACFECAPPAVTVSGGDESGIIRPGVCAASLPTTMSIVAGLMVQASLKYFLDFGTITGCLGYNALTDFFPAYDIKANPDCVNENCRGLQAKAAEERKNKPTTGSLDVVDESMVNHELNDWGIALVSEEEVFFGEQNTANDSREDFSSLSLSDLMSRLKKR
jgi:ubiquitin-like modifier-activating enzyme 5